MAKENSQYTCNYCKDSGVIIENNGNTISTCIYCLNVQKFMEALKLAIKDSRANGKNKMSKDLKAVEEFLPNYPVMAYLEGQARSVSDTLLEMLRSTFNILPLG